MKDNRIGLKPKHRKIGRVSNQWKGTAQQLKFMEAWLNPISPTFGNAYQSAKTNNYSEHYARQLASPAVNNKWIQDYDRLIKLTGEHIQQGIQQIAIKANNSKSPDDTRLKAYETLARISGMLDNKQNVNVTIVQPILSGASVKQVEEIKEAEVVEPHTPV